MTELEFTRTNPFMAKVTERYPLTKPGSLKNTYHVVLDLRGSGLTYKVGDSIAVYPVNDPSLVIRLLERLGATGEESITTKKGEALVFSEFLSSRANISRCSKRLLTLLAERHTNFAKKADLETLLSSDQALIKEYLEQRELWDLLEEHNEVAFTPQEITDLLGPLLPRFYSIASSMPVVGEEVHLTIALTHYVSNGHPRKGVCSHYLCDLVPPLVPLVPVYMQPSKDFTLPADGTAPIIMVGPGTGVAPYRGFMQERVANKARGQNWLFFGECNRAYDFFYEEYWHHLVKDGHLRLDVAFSRDQAEKVYVQHRLLEHAAEIYQWLEKGAYLYVCGDADHMAKDVDQALNQIVTQHLGAEAAKPYIKTLREEGRYLRDVY